MLLQVDLKKSENSRKDFLDTLTSPFVTVSQSVELRLLHLIDNFSFSYMGMLHTEVTRQYFHTLPQLSESLMVSDLWKNKISVTSVVQNKFSVFRIAPHQIVHWFFFPLLMEFEIKSINMGSTASIWSALRNPKSLPLTLPITCNVSPIFFPSQRLYSVLPNF